ncbi:MAG: class I SAM-dependent methyltransferase [Candidatus Promineifilaceae bacterium]|nr:class I SAM-dependent methyltransferase [Candidatus Promineifilaceae bacterium]
MDSVNYDEIAATYDRRYAVDPLDGVAVALERLAADLGAQRILEIGCGTGRWLDSLASRPGSVFGIDASMGMLRRARERDKGLQLVCGRAERLPLAEGRFDLLFVVNALHHFDERERFVRRAWELLRPGGALAIVGFDPHSHRDWYIYQYFDGTYALDVARMPALATLRGWLGEAGFGDVEQREVARVDLQRRGREILDDPFLQKEGTSELALLSDEAYRAGLSRIRSAIAAAEQDGKQATFTARIDFVMTAGRR